MTKTIVNCFEVIKVEQHHGYAGIIAIGINHRLVQTLQKARAVCQAGECVVIGHEKRCLFG